MSANNVRDFSALSNSGSSFQGQRLREMSSPAFGSGGGGREMPSAFGSGDRDRKRDEARAYAERKAADDRAKRLAAEKEAKRLSDAMNFTSEESYPALGAAAAPKTAKPALNFSAAAAKPAALRPVAVPVKATIIPTRCYDDLPEDYDGPDEGEEEGEDGEFNADLGSTRRRGDKGIW